MQVILEEQAKLTQQALADHQERLALLASGLQEQQQQQYVQSKRNAAVVADLQTKVTVHPCVLLFALASHRAHDYPISPFTAM